MKENVCVFLFVGFFIMMLIPRLIKGFVKSTTLSLSDEIVMPAKATSAFCKDKTHESLYFMAA
jgi:hypothetical protein